LDIRLQIVQNPELYRIFEHRLYVCPKHFVSGQPAPLYDFDNVDWIPTLNLPKLDSDRNIDIPMNNDSKYKCRYCPQWYQSQDGVLRHMATHTDEEKEEWPKIKLEIDGDVFEPKME
jgi:hypothetical protein